MFAFVNAASKPVLRLLHIAVREAVSLGAW